LDTALGHRGQLAVEDIGPPKCRTVLLRLGGFNVAEAPESGSPLNIGAVQTINSLACEDAVLD
jgi:hypothetical protein